MAANRAKTRKIYYLAIVLIVGICTAVTFSQPRAGGHSLNYWLDYGWHPSTGLFDPDAEAALKEIGMNAIMNVILQETPSFESKLQAKFYYLLPRNYLRQRSERRLSAARALDQIFPNKKPQIFTTFINDVNGKQGMGKPAYSALIQMEDLPMDLVLQELANPKRDQVVLLNILQNRTRTPVFNEFRLLVSEVPEARWKGISRLEGAIKDPLVFAAVSEMLNDKDSDVRLAALTAITKNGLGPTVREKVKERLDDNDEKVRSLAASLLKEEPSQWE